MPVTDEDEEFLMETEDMRPTHVGIQRMIGAALHVFEETTSVRRIEGIINTKVISLLETANHKGCRGQKTLVYQAVEKFVRRVVA